MTTWLLTGCCLIQCALVIGMGRRLRASTLEWQGIVHGWKHVADLAGNRAEAWERTATRWHNQLVRALSEPAPCALCEARRKYPLPFQPSLLDVAVGEARPVPADIPDDGRACVDIVGREIAPGVYEGRDSEGRVCLGIDPGRPM